MKTYVIRKCNECGHEQAVGSILFDSGKCLVCRSSNTSSYVGSKPAKVRKPSVSGVGKPKPDFTYQIDNDFVLLMPETPEATAVWNEEIAPKTSGTGKFWAMHFPQIKLQLQNAGYRVHKARKVKEPVEQLLKKLNS